MFHHILVPLDGSLRAERAIPIAARLARASHGMLIILRIVSAPPEAGSAPVAELPLARAHLGKQLEEAQAYLTALASSREMAGIPLTVATLPGPVVSTILTAIHTYQADLLVLCEEELPQGSHAFTGSLAEQLSEHITIPFLLIPAHGSLSLGQKHLMTLLVAYEGSQPAPRLLKSAIALLTALASQGQGHLHCIRPLSFNAQAAHQRSSIAEGTPNERKTGAGSLGVTSQSNHLDWTPCVEKSDLLALGMPPRHMRAEAFLEEDIQPFLHAMHTHPLLCISSSTLAQP